jgi:hypothetical protein
LWFTGVFLEASVNGIVIDIGFVLGEPFL